MAEERGASPRQGKMSVDTALVRELAEMLAETGLTEIAVEDGDRKIKVSRASIAAPVSYAAAPAPAAPAAPVEQAVAAKPAPVDALKSPMVGTAYLAAEPGVPDFIAVGKQVKVGDTLLIIEAMKVMNPIAAPRAGVVKEIIVQDAQPVEYDQPLVVVE